jgi:hypothetical protein
MPSFSVVSAVICEDVRREANGQATIVGASPIGPPIRKGGQSVRAIAFFIEIITKQVSDLDIRLVKEESEQIVFERNFTLPVAFEEADPDWEAHTLMVVGFQDLEMPSPGPYLLQGRPPEGEWKNIRLVLFPQSDDNDADQE